MQRDFRFYQDRCREAHSPTVLHKLKKSCFDKFGIFPIIGAYDDQQRKIGTAIYAANQVSRIPITPSGILKYLYMRLSGTVTVASGTTDGALVPEQPLSLIKQIEIEIDGKRRKIIDAATLYMLNKYYYSAGDELTSLSIPGVQTTTAFVAGIKYDFQLPLMKSLASHLTMLDTTRHANSLYLIITWGNTTDMILGGDRTITFPTNPTLEIVGHEVLKPRSEDRAELLYDESTLIVPIAASNTQLEIQLTRGGLYRGLMVKAVAGTNGNTLTDALVNDFSLKKNIGSLGNLYMREKVPWYNLKSNNKVEFGLETLPTGYGFIDFSNSMDISSLVDTTKMDDFRLLANVSLQSGTNYLRVSQLQMIQI